MPSNPGAAFGMSVRNRVACSGAPADGDAPSSFAWEMIEKVTLSRHSIGAAFVSVGIDAKLSLFGTSSYRRDRTARHDG